MWKERFRKIKIIATIILILGVAVYLIIAYQTAKSISIVEKKITGVYPLSLDNYEVRFSLTLKNPKNFDIEIDYISYNIYVENEFVGKGVKSSFFIENGIHEYDFSAIFSIKNTSKATQQLIMKNDANVKIKGEILIPAKFLGLFTWKHIKIPYEINKKI